MKNPTPSTIKTCNCGRKKTLLWIITVFLSALFKTHVLIELQINVAMVWENIFKERYNNHKCSFKNKSRGNITDLSKYAWEFKETCLLFYQLGYCYEIKEICLQITKV